MSSSLVSESEDRVLAFRVAGKAYSIPAGTVLEIMRRPGITRVPHAPRSLAGLMNFHGLAIPVVRMAGLLGDVESNGAAETRVIVYDEAPPVGLLVDDVLQLGTEGQAAKRLNLPELLAKGFVAPAVEKTRVARSTREESASERVDPELALLNFRVGGQRFALPLEAVTEVMVLPEDLVVVPGSEAIALGVVEYRHSVIPLISLAGLLGLQESHGRRYVLVTSLGEVLVALVAEAIEGVRHVRQSSIEPVPAILQRGEGDAEIEAIARLGGERSLVSILSPSRLFGNREVGRAIDQMSPGTAAMAIENIQGTDLQFVMFRLGDEAYALPIAAVDEILQLPAAVTRVPNAPDFIAGVINLRGKALPIIDQRHRFDTAAPQSPARPRVIVVTMGELQAGFIVDAVSQILRVPESEVTPAPSLPGEGARVFDRIAPSDTEESMILIIDPKELLDRAERDLLEQFEPKQGSAAYS